MRDVRPHSPRAAVPSAARSLAPGLWPVVDGRRGEHHQVGVPAGVIRPRSFSPVQPRRSSCRDARPRPNRRSPRRGCATPRRAPSSRLRRRRTARRQPVGHAGSRPSRSRSPGGQHIVVPALISPAATGGSSGKRCGFRTHTILHRIWPGGAVRLSPIVCAEFGS